MTLGTTYDDPRSYCEYYKTNFGNRMVKSLKGVKDGGLGGEGRRGGVAKGGLGLLKKIEPGLGAGEGLGEGENKQGWPLGMMQLRSMGGRVARVKKENQYSQYIDSRLMTCELGLIESKQDTIGVEEREELDSGGSG